MSYILDALKKSEQERQEKSTPNIQTIQRPHQHNQSDGWATKYVAAFSIVALLLVAVLYFFGAGFIASLTNENVKLIAVNNAIIAVDKTAESAVLLPEPSANNSQSVDNTKPIAQPLLMEFWELPDPVQKEIPPMTFSFHVYSDNPERRTIIINSHRVKEGGVVSAGLVLEEVTKEGVILNWQDQYRFTMSVVTGW